MKKPRQKWVGSGITRRLRTTYDWRDPDDRAAWAQRTSHCVDAVGDFPAWLNILENDVARALKRFDLPAPNKFVAYEKDCPRSWRYEDNLFTPGVHAATEWYLQKAFPEQSSFWYLGSILYRIKQCRLAIEAGEFLQAAGQAMLLGRIDREMLLKFSGEKRLRRFEWFDSRRTAGLDSTNATKRKDANRWHGIARHILRNSPDIDPRGKKSETAKALQAKWPQGKKIPNQRSLEDWLRLETRHVFPEM